MDYESRELTGPPLEELGPECPAPSSPTLWIVLLILFLLIIIGLIIWLVIVYRRDKENPKDPVINLTNPQIAITSDSSVTATWDSTDKDDTIILWVTQEPPRIDSTGKVTNSRFFKQQAASGATTVTVPGLQPQAKYYATLIASNPDKTVNYQSYTQIVYMESHTPPVGSSTTNAFSIQDILQVGRFEIVAGSTGTVSPVQLVQKFSDVPSTLWFVNSNGQIENANSSVCLFNSSGNLAVDDCATLQGDVNKKGTAQWTYNPATTSGGSSNSNKWCLTSTLSNTTPTCMILGTLGSTGQTNITVGTSQNPEGFVNVCELSCTNFT